MTTKQERLKEVYNHLRNHFGVHTQIDFAEAIRITRPALSSAMNGNEAYLTKNLFQKICAAYPGVFNLDYLLTGDGDLLTLEEEVRSNEFEKQMTQQNNIPPATDQTYFMSKVIESIETSHAQQVASLNQQIATLNSQLADRKSIIDLQADKINLQDDKIKSQADEIARLQKVIDDIRVMPSSYDIEEYIRNNPFSVGVADHPDTTRAQI